MTLLQFTERALIIAGVWVLACVAVLWLLARARRSAIRRDRRELRRSAEQAYREAIHDVEA